MPRIRDIRTVDRPCQHRGTCTDRAVSWAPILKIWLKPCWKARGRALMLVSIGLALKVVMAS